MNKQTDYGQYFTTNQLLKEKLYNFILNEPTTILEPSVGRGDLVCFVKEKKTGIHFDMYEIDKDVPLLSGVTESGKVTYADFMTQNIEQKYTTVIGNPPFVRTKRGNLYIDFTEKCFNLLVPDGGEMIFIVPSDFFKLTCASKLLDKMMKNGNFTHIFHPNNEKLFENASIDVLVFRYCRSLTELQKQVLYNDKLLYVINKNGFITFIENDPTATNTTLFTFDYYFDVYVGLVTGKEDVYKNRELGNIDIINGENKVEKYIYVESFPCPNEKINSYLLEHKPVLIGRAIRKFNEKNWFEWGAPRNISVMRMKRGSDCIYLSNLTRHTNVAFLEKVNYFGGGLLMLLPKKNINLQKIVTYMNSNTFKENFMFSGRFKIGHRQICNSQIPAEYIELC
jgi:adenine-specific DNA-methyltransferase